MAESALTSRHHEVLGFTNRAERSGGLVPMSAEKRQIEADDAEDVSNQGDELDFASMSEDHSGLSSNQSKFAGRWRFRDWRALPKISAILVIPLIAVLGFAGVQIRNALADETRARQAEQIAGLNVQGIDVARELQTERDLTGIYLGSKRQQGDDKLLEQRSRVDSVVQDYSSTRQNIGNDFDPSTNRLLSNIEQSVSELAEIRQSVDSAEQPQWPTAFDKYSSIVSLLGKLPTQAAQEGLANPDFRAQSIGSTALLANSDLVSAERGYWAYVYSAGKLQGTDQQELFGIAARQKAAADEFLANSTTAQRENYQSTVTNELSDSVNQLRKSALESSANSDLQVNPTEWFNKATDLLAKMDSVNSQIAQQLKDKASALRSTAQRTTIAVVAIVCLVVVGACALAVLGARILLGPIRQLRTAARGVVEHRLPNLLSQSGGTRTDNDRNSDPIPIESADEIGEVSQAFNSLYQAVVKSTADQELLRQNVSATFVNLSRRTQSLVERQLRVIDDLERGEQDPEQLGHLFQIDHLATRMRRNAENLLVLAGAESGRRWSQPIALLDVLRAAAAEVEQYHRVVNAEIADYHVEGRVVGDLVHLIAELLENALEFSSPDTNVAVRAQRSTEMPGVTIEIEDHGIGMSEHELQAANHRLANTNEDELELSRMMGLYVVGRLASRLHLKVELQVIPDGGVLAAIKIPERLIVGQHHDDLTNSQAGINSTASDTGTSIHLDPTGKLLPDESVLGDKLISETRPLLPVKERSSRRESAGQDTLSGTLQNVPLVEVSVNQENKVSGAADTGATSAISILPTESLGSQLPPELAPDQPGLANGESVHQQSTASESVSSETDVAADSLETILQSTEFSERAQSKEPANEPDNAVPQVIDPDEEAFIELTETSQFSQSDLTGTLQPDALQESSVLENSVAIENGHSDQELLPDNLLGNGISTASNEQNFDDFAAPAASVIADDDYTPIFASIESEWFKQRRSSDSRESILPSTQDSSTSSSPSGLPATKDIAQSAELSSTQQSSSANPWTSPADEGWRAAQQAMKPRISGTTKAGLPIRVPLAHYVPGSVGGDSSRVSLDRRNLAETENPRGAISRDSVADSGQSLEPIKRSPDAVRGLLASYQSGLNRGREAAGRHRSTTENDPIGPEIKE